MGFFTALSSNGTLIDAPMCERIKAIGFDYVGVSLDGLGATHDKFRRMQGAFDLSLAGIRLCREAGLKVGVRYTMTQDNFQDLPGLLELVEDEGIDRFYFSHLNYAGRGNKNRKDDALHQMTRNAMDLLFDTCWSYQERGLVKEFTTGNNDADGVYLLLLAAAPLPGQGRAHPQQAGAVGRQFQRRERRQHRQPRQRASRHHVVALHAGQPARAFLRRDLDGHQRPADGRPQGASAHGRRPLRRLRPFRHLRRQHAGARPAAHRRSLVGRSGLLPRRRGNRRRLTPVKQIENRLPTATLCRRSTREGGLMIPARATNFGRCPMTQNAQDTAADKSEMGSLLLGAGFALASLIILPAVAQRIGLGSSLTIALRGALMRAANRV
jgi:hypothetical protein